MGIVAILAGSPVSGSSPAPADEAGVVTIRTVAVGDPGNASVGVVSVFGGANEFVDPPANGGIYTNCDEAPPGPPYCLTVGGVGYPYQIGETEVTVQQYVTFLNVVDPHGRNDAGLYRDMMGPDLWPKYGSVAFDASADRGAHYSVADPTWADKPFGFADFPRAARFANSLSNGTILSQKSSTEGGFPITTYRVRLSHDTEKGMYDMSDPSAERAASTGFVIPSNDEWIKAGHYDPSGRGTLGYWQYPTGPTDAPNVALLDPSTGDVVNAGHQPLAVYNPGFLRRCPAPIRRGAAHPTWSSRRVTARTRSTSPGVAAAAWQATSPRSDRPRPAHEGWRTPPGSGWNVVEWQDTIVPPREGMTISFLRISGRTRCPFGFQPQDQYVLDGIYPWFGFRVGFIGDGS
ncbi:MAG: hypothetical protein R3C32_09990 [Chloroflexota bacterium]